MNKNSLLQLSRRERQIMDIIYQHGEASVAEVLENMPDPPSYSAVRAMVRILEEKGHLKHRVDGTKFIFKPTLPTENAKRSVLSHLVQTYFDGSVEQVVAALLDSSSTALSEAELDRLSQLIQEARKEGR